MRLSRIAVILVVSVFALTVLACGGPAQPSLIKPTVTYVPSGLSLDGDQPPDKDNIFVGSIYYKSTVDNAWVRINYEAIPFWYAQDCQICFKGDILGEMKWRIQQAESSTTPGITLSAESGTMTVGGQSAAYCNLTYHGTTGDNTLMYIGCIKDNTYFEITVSYCASNTADCNANTYSNAMALINSITF
jgi:hypothetical protein